MNQIPKDEAADAPGDDRTLAEDPRSEAAVDTDVAVPPSEDVPEPEP